MPKGLTIMGMGVGALMFVLFTADLAIGQPFGGAHRLMDITFLVCGLILSYLGWSTYKKLV